MQQAGLMCAILGAIVMSVDLDFLTESSPAKSYQETSSGIQSQSGMRTNTPMFCSPIIKSNLKPVEKNQQRLIVIAPEMLMEDLHYSYYS